MQLSQLTPPTIFFTFAGLRHWLNSVYSRQAANQAQTVACEARAELPYCAYLSCLVETDVGGWLAWIPKRQLPGAMDCRVPAFHVYIQQNWEVSWIEHSIRDRWWPPLPSKGVLLLETPLSVKTDRWKDITFIVRLHEGEPEMMITVCRQHAKGMTNTSHRRYVMFSSWTSSF